MPNPLSWLGAVMPEPSSAQISAEQRKKYEAEQQLKKRQFRQEHPIRGAIADAADTAFDYLGGLTGLSDNPESTANMMGQLTDAATDLIPAKAAIAKGLSLAGMPFAFYQKSGRVAEGLSRARRGDYSIIDDTMIGGKDKGNVYGKGVYSFERPEAAKKFHESYQEEGMPEIGGIDVLDADAKNVLDLVEPNTIDIIKYANSFPETVRSTHREFVKGLMDKGMSSDEAYKELSKALRNLPGEMEDITKAGFDAVRYPYGGENAWVFPTSTPLYKMEKGQRVPFNQSALSKRRETVAPTPKAEEKVTISVAPEGFKPPEGAVLPSGRKMPLKKEKETAVAVAEPEGPKPEFNKKRMSLAELMASGTPKPEMRTVKLPNGKIIQITKEEFDKMRGGRR